MPFHRGPALGDRHREDEISQSRHAFGWIKLFTLSHDPERNQGNTTKLCPRLFEAAGALVDVRNEITPDIDHDQA